MFVEESYFYVLGANVSCIVFRINFENTTLFDSILLLHKFTYEVLFNIDVLGALAYLLIVCKKTGSLIILTNVTWNI